MGKQKKTTCKDTQTFCTFCKQSKINVVAKQNLNKNYSSETCIDLRKKNVIFGVQNSIQRHEKKLSKKTQPVSTKRKVVNIFMFIFEKI